ncbi:GntR family transcriptional regulator [Roseomonas hellenica]|uniref:GntR family transcriptional regulator n=1 Tax=Plastoroseomonas hellenica TaxID=2687306 RepID=A0ABS5F839_9PROT|nr:GntR family transcriptional regulator [Plastoroseomonas hellenica]MBR0668734.1 GntR family transcriptional regulator [Plastoroseomonas hellenica]
MGPDEARGGEEGRGRDALPDRLATEILQHARHAGLGPGAHLREQALAEAFRVSRTPIRQALEMLAAQDLVERHRHRGFFLKALPAEPAGPAPGAAAAEVGEDPLYARIAEDHLDERLPARVTESELARRYGVTRSRLQRPLARLAREGLLERLPGQGWEFLPVLRSPEAYEQGYRFRALIEPAALMEAGYALAPETAAHLRARLRAVLDGGWKTWPRTEVQRAGAEFHEAIVAASGNPFLLESIRRVNRMRLLLERRISGATDRERLIRTNEDHLRILDMIEAGDREGASHVLRAHLWQELRVKRC